MLSEGVGSRAAPLLGLKVRLSLSLLRWWGLQAGVTVGTCAQGWDELSPGYCQSLDTGTCSTRSLGRFM